MLFFIRSGSVIVDLIANLLDHPIAEDIFFASLNSLELGRIFSDSPVLGAVPGMSGFLPPASEGWGKVKV